MTSALWMMTRVCWATLLFISGPTISQEAPRQPETQNILRIERSIAAPRSAAFRVWTDPQAIKEWFLYHVEGHWSPDPAPVLAVTPGGSFRWSVVSNGSGREFFQFHGTYRVVQPPSKLEFTWDWESLPIPGVESPGKTIVTLDLLEESAGTRLILTQTGFPNEAAREAHRKGWERCLDGIINLLTSGQKETANAAQPFVREQANVIALEHVRVIDGTGAEAQQDQTILISGGKIAALGASGSIQIPAGAQRLSSSGYTAIPGLVGMHNHLFYSVNFFGSYGEIRAYSMPFSYPRLYLASGVTTIRTSGSFEPYTDLEIKKAVDAGTLIGPKMNATGPYLEGEPFPMIQIHKLTGPEDARRIVDFWAAEGAGSFKVYQNITREELAAAIEAAHKNGLTITGHLCSIGFREAAELGIDSLEHGLYVDTEFSPAKQPDKCPSPNMAGAADLEIDGAEIQTLIKTLVNHHVAVTSTLPVFEAQLPSGPDAPQRVLEVLSSDSQKAYQEDRQAGRAAMEKAPIAAQGRAFQRYALMLKKEMEFERAFVRAGGLLMAGSDAVFGGHVAGFGDQREVELLVEAGFTPVEAIKIATLNGAMFLKQADRIGSLAIGKQADIALVRGDPSANIRDIENVELVFKDGVGYDSRKLFDSVKGQVGIR